MHSKNYYISLGIVVWRVCRWCLSTATEVKWVLTLNFDTHFRSLTVLFRIKSGSAYPLPYLLLFDQLNLSFTCFKRDLIHPMLVNTLSDCVKLFELYILILRKSNYLFTSLDKLTCSEFGNALWCIMREDIYCTRDFHVIVWIQWWSCLLYKGWFTVWGHTGFVWFESFSCYSIIPSCPAITMPKFFATLWIMSLNFSVCETAVIFLTPLYIFMNTSLWSSIHFQFWCSCVVQCIPAIHYGVFSIHVAGLFGLERTLVARACWSEGALKGKQMSFFKLRFLHCMVPRTSTSMQSAPCVQSAKP